MAFTASNRPTAALARVLLSPLLLGYALYALLLFIALAGGALLAMLVLPGVQRCRRIARVMARTFLWCAGMPLRVNALQRLPSGPCVVVSNHASYLDGVVFTAALPPRFGFVIKREMARVPLAGLFLRKLGSEFVERVNRHRGAADARRVLRSAANGSSLMFFPEGTFPQQAGVLRFHTGAFAAAARAGCPLVPAIVRGTRRRLPPGIGLPCPGRIEVEILPAIETTADCAESAALELRIRARHAILDALGEPDLDPTCCADTDHPLHRAHARSAPASRP
ncbi:MAG: 1-acyl-sn-glycerol-3-phosphate acyltransferase [Sinobacteraceae bacterium]|nr:1-acyl-sn-glycerol-3-phosphate acyltransferase [Nevskiaceae bacterium]MBV8852279.1 1-acyl-sn-glycerol-3-phosphate acyltransferase [Nevskiaceae bacterium]